MNNWHVFTSEREQQAIPKAMYLVIGAETESEAVEKCYQAVKDNNLRPMSYLRRYSIPDYTCAVSV